jgi:Dual OB-containing domain
MSSSKANKAAGPRDLLILVVGRAEDEAVALAGIDTATGAWVRAVDPSGNHVLPVEVLTLPSGATMQVMDTVRVAGITKTPHPPFVEDAVLDLTTPPTRVGHIEERALSRTLAELAVPHLETLLPAGKRVLTPKDFQPGGRQRSIALVRPDELQHIHFTYEGEDVRVGVSFRHRGQAYGGPTGLPCPDVRLRAFARAALRKDGALKISLDGRACYNRFACGRIYLTVGLVEGAEGTYWPQVLGFHPIREYPASIDYARL